MMDLVIDANILFAALIRRGRTGALLFEKGLRLFAPGLLLEELSEHKERLLARTERSDEEFEWLLGAIRRRITFVSPSELLPFLSRSEEIAPDPDNAPYFAVALCLQIPLWSNERRLQEQGVVRIISTRALLGIVSRGLY